MFAAIGKAAACTLRAACALLLLITLAVPSTASFAANYAETFDSGAAPGWTVVSGNWAVAAGTANSTADGAADIAVYGGASWATDFVYHVSINNQYNNWGNLAGAIFNYQDANNYYAVKFAPVAGPGTERLAHLIKVINGTTTEITASYNGGDPLVWFEVDVIRSGINTTVKVNGITVFGNVAQGELGLGKIGLITTFTHGQFDNVVLTEANPAPPITRTGPHFPRLGAYPIGNPHNYDEAVFRDRARKYHVVIVSHWPGWQLGRSMTMAQVMQNLKFGVGNPRTFIYVNNNEQADPPQVPGDPVWQKLTDENWWLYKNGTCCEPVTSTFGLRAINNTLFGPRDNANPSKNWIEWKTDFDYAFNVVGDANNAPNTTYLDGFFMDNISWTPRERGDWNRDGTTDCLEPDEVHPCTATEARWMRDGYKSYFDYVRSIWQPGTFVAGGLQIGNIANWGDTLATIDVLNQVLDGGVMEGMIGESWSIETWGTFNSADPSVNSMMGWYRKMIDACRAPKLAIFGHDNWVMGNYRDMRYGLATTLMDDAYYYISGMTGYDPSNLLWFDEFDFDLGYPIQPRQEAQWSQGVWRRDFDNGIVLVNPKGNGVQTVNLGGTFRKLSGTQDPVTNNGMTVTSVTLLDRDGIVLRR